MSIRDAVVLSVAALLLSACSGGQSQGQAVSLLPKAAVRPHTGRLQLVVRIPRRTHRRAHYISSSTRGISFAFTGSATLSFAVGLTPATNSGCTGYPSATMCTIELALPPGSYTFSASAYESAPVNGHIPNGADLLSTASGIPITVTAGQNNTASLTLDGVPAQFAITNIPSATSGTSFGSPQAFTVNVKDTSGETIVGTYATAVTLATGNPAHTSIVTSGSDNPPSGELLSSTDSAKLTYDGAAVVAGITATSGSASLTVGFVPAGVSNGVYRSSDSSIGSNPGLCPGGAPGELRAVMCAASSGATIAFGCGNPCTIVLNAPLPPIAQNLTIDGGAFGNVVIDGATRYRAFYAQSGTVALDNLLIQNALAPGGAGGGSPSNAGAEAEAPDWAEAFSSTRPPSR